MDFSTLDIAAYAFLIINLTIVLGSACAMDKIFDRIEDLVSTRSPAQLAVECLRLIVEQPGSLKIEAVSQVMVIIGDQELTNEERASIASSLAKYVAPWKERSNAIDLKSPRIISLIESEMQIDLMSSTPMNDSCTRNRVTGYKVAVDYSCVSVACGRYRSRHWFFFGPDKRIIYKSLEVPQQ